MIYLLYNGFAHNTAPGNRFLAISRGIKESGIQHINVFTSPSDINIHIDEALYGKSIVFWPNLRVGNGFIMKVVRRFLIRYFCPLRLSKFLIGLRKDDIVVLINDIINMHTVLDYSDKIGYRVYQERTEHPSAVKVFPTDDLENRYIKDCERLDGMFVIQTNLKKAFVSLGVNESKINIINMIVDSTRFEGINKTENHEKYIAYCGKISNNKDGVDDLIRSFKIVAESIPEIKLYIIGQSPRVDENTENVKLIHSLGLTDRIVFTGLVKAEDMPLMLKNAEVLVLARPKNLQAEHGFPTKLGEYLLTENPVVITRTGTIDEFLEDMVSALLCEPSNVNEIASKIIWALTHVEESRCIGKRGAEVALKCFNYRNEAQKIVDIITK